VGQVGSRGKLLHVLYADFLFWARRLAEKKVGDEKNKEGEEKEMSPGERSRERVNTVATVESSSRQKGGGGG